MLVLQAALAFGWDFALVHNVVVDFAITMRLSQGLLHTYEWYQVELIKLSTLV